jgi:hypothetical protein
MYYRIAIRCSEEHQGQSPLWKWYSTALGSLNSVLLFFQYYHALPLDRLRVFSSSSREELKEQLLRENCGLGSHSVPAEHFLRELFRPLAEKMVEVPAHQIPEPASIKMATNRSSTAYHTGVHALVEQGMRDMERRREETEGGAGGNHDLPYSFTLPGSWPQVRAWMRLLARLRTGELEP